MKIRRRIPLSAVIILAIYFSTFSSCTKEYSCESCLIRDSLPPNDTTTKTDTLKIDSTINFPFCPSCDNNQVYSFNRWGFRNYESLVCGNVYYAALDSGYIVTFRGFQDCTRDTQFVITGRFPSQTFEADQLNVPASYCNFLLYAPNNVILAVGGGTNGTPLTMNAVLDSFNYSTGVASFRFFGYAYTNKGGSSYITGDSSYVSDGRVQAQIR